VGFERVFGFDEGEEGFCACELGGVPGEEGLQVLWGVQGGADAGEEFEGLLQEGGCAYGEGEDVGLWKCEQVGVVSC
jgi:hypothetical protein